MAKAKKTSTAKALVLITGATGFIGRHAVTALIGAGYRVRALCRSSEPSLLAEGAEVVRGDVLDRASVDAAVAGATFVVHGAGLVSRDQRDASTMLRLHTLGTRHVVEAAVAAGVTRVVHLSTSGTVACGDDPAMVYREDDPPPFTQLARFPYYLSKWLAERAAADAVLSVDGRPAGAGLSTRTELITLNPSLALGPGDVRGSSTEDVRRFLKRELPVVPSGGFSFVDARDVAEVVVTALTSGDDGERYLLGAQNLTFADFFSRLERISGVKGPPLPIVLPKKVTTLGIGLLERASGFLGATLPVSLIEAEMASSFWYVDSRKAEQALGFAPRDANMTLLDTVKDIRGQGKKEKLVEARVA